MGARKDVEYDVEAEWAADAAWVEAVIFAGKIPGGPQPLKLEPGEPCSQPHTCGQCPTLCDRAIRVHYQAMALFPTADSRRTGMPVLSNIYLGDGKIDSVLPSIC